MAEAGREFNERVRPEQLSLFNHRESYYISALERRFFVTRHTRRARPIRDSLNRSLPQAATKSASRAYIGATLASPRSKFSGMRPSSPSSIGDESGYCRSGSDILRRRCHCNGGERCCSRTGARRFPFARGGSASTAAMGSHAQARRFSNRDIGQMCHAKRRCRPAADTVAIHAH